MYDQARFDTVNRIDILRSLEQKPKRVEQLAEILRADELELWRIVEQMVFDGLLYTDVFGYYHRKESTQCQNQPSS